MNKAPFPETHLRQSERTQGPLRDGTLITQKKAFYPFVTDEAKSW